MTLRLFLLSLCVSLGLFQTTQADEARKHPDAAFLWKVEGKDLKQASYLFGTVHVSAPAVINLHPAAQAAFESADRVYTEVPMDMASQLKMAPMLIRTDGKTLAGSLGPKNTKRLDAQLAAVNPALNHQALNTMKTWFVALTLPILEEQMQGKQPLDVQLWNRAEKAGKQTGAIETFKTQLGKMDQLTEAEQVELSVSMIGAMEEAAEKGTDPLADLLEAYLKGDAKQLEKALDATMEGKGAISPELEKKFTKLLIHDRNLEMSASIQKQLTAHPDEVLFFAAGTAHYIGDTSIVTLLQKAGYTVTRIQK